MLHSRLRFHQVDDQGPQQLCPHLLRRIPTYGPLQVCKTLHIIELFAFHALVRFRTHRKKRKSEIRRKKLEGGHVARLMHDERGLFQPELDGRTIGVGIEDIAETRRSHIHFRRHCRTPPGYFFTAVCTASITCSSVGIVIISPFILFVCRPILEGMELVHLLLTLRGPVWRIRILIHGDPRIRWRAYRVAEYPTPDAVVRRCAEGLVSGHENDKHDEPHGNGEEKVIQHGSPLRVRWECWGRL
jgi:hypothetical protein